MTAPLLGFGLPISGSWATRQNMALIAERAEELGYHSLWTFQRLLHPAEGDWGPMYRAVHDPIVALAHVAALTRRVRLGTAVVNAPFYPPIVLAKQLTTLDEVSAGRLDAGIGLGWAEQEMVATNAAQRRRGARMDEFVRCLKAIWGDDPVSFEGEFYRVPAAQVQPKPVQRPHPPVLLGGSAEAALRRVGRLADGWISASRHDLRRIGGDVAVIRAAAQQAGRDPDRIRVVTRGVVRLADAGLEVDTAKRRPLQGSAEQIRADLDDLAAAGVTEVFLDLNFVPEVGSPDADPQHSMRVAEQVLDAFAPAAGG
jgi:probable F420-dependent oxidoreductase